MNSITLYNDDCFNVIKSIPNKSINLIITDPPYLHNKGGGKTHGTEGKSKIANSSMYNFDSPMMKEMSSFGEKEIFNLLDEFKRIMVKLNAYMFCNDTQIYYYLKWANEHNKKYTILTWEKPLSILNRNRFSQNLEYIVRIYDNGTALNLLDIEKHPTKKQYYSKNRKLNKPTNKRHPLQKPNEYIRGLIELSSNENDIIFDPFMGSGVVCEESILLHRNFIGIEKEKEYFNKTSKYIYSKIDKNINFILR